MGHSKSSPDRQVHIDIGRPEKDRNILNEQPNSTPTSTQRITANTAQSK